MIILELLQRFLKDLNFNQQEQHFKSLNLNLTFAPYVYSADLRYFPEILQLIPILPKENFKKGDYVLVHIISCTAGTLIGTPSAP